MQSLWIGVMLWRNDEVYSIEARNWKSLFPLSRTRQTHLLTILYQHPVQMLKPHWSNTSTTILILGSISCQIAVVMRNAVIEMNLSSPTPLASAVSALSVLVVIALAVVIFSRWRSRSSSKADKNNSNEYLRHCLVVIVREWGEENLGSLWQYRYCRSEILRRGHSR